MEILKAFDCKAIRGNDANSIIVTAKIHVLLQIQSWAKGQGHDMTRNFHPTEIKNNYTQTAVLRLLRETAPAPVLTERQSKILNFIAAQMSKGESCWATKIYAHLWDVDISLIGKDLRFLQGEGLITRNAKDHHSFVPLEISERNRGISITYGN